MYILIFLRNQKYQKNFNEDADNLHTMLLLNLYIMLAKIAERRVFINLFFVVTAMMHI